MSRLLPYTVIAIALFVGSPNARGQGRTSEVELLKKELDLLKRELDLLKRENELLKKENAELRKGSSGSTARTSDATETDAVTRVTVDNVEYVYQGGVRNGGSLIVTVLATSKDGNQVGPNGQMTLIDTEGNKFSGRPLQGFGNIPTLREGIPVKLAWQFGGGNAFTGAAQTAPSTKITRFAGVIIHRAVAAIGGGDNTIDFRNVPLTVSKAKAK